MVTMKRASLAAFLLVCATIPVIAISVDVEAVLEAPGDFTMFLNPAAAYGPNGQLLVKSVLAFNLFVLDDDDWVQLIDRYRTDEYNVIPDGNRNRGVNWLYNSTVEGEMLYKARRGALEPEHYRVFVNDDEELQAEWVSKEYYDAHLLRYLSRGWSLEEGLALLYAYRIETPQDPISASPEALLPQIVGRDGAVAYEFMEEFPDGFVEDWLSITRNTAGDRVAMAISFIPAQDSPYYRPNFRRTTLMAIFSIDYGDAATRVESQHSEAANQSESAEASIEPLSTDREADAVYDSNEPPGGQTVSAGLVAGGIAVALIVVLAAAAIVRRRRS
jgi:hypothetical protein